MTATPGVLHNYSGALTAFQHHPQHANLLIFIGGLGDGLATVPYVRPVADALDKLGWSTVEILTRSSFQGWGSGTLERDNKDVLAAITYFKNLPLAADGKNGQEERKIVLMGHSTGSQNTLHYISQGTAAELEARPKLNGAVLQAGVSDRQAYLLSNSEAVWRESLDHAAQLGPREFMPTKYTAGFFPAPITARRWRSLLAVRGADDYFSSDLDDTRDFAGTFGKVEAAGRTPKLLVLYSGADEFVPPAVDKAALVRRFQNATGPNVWSEYSGVVPGATHFLGSESTPEAIPDLIRRLTSFLNSL